MDRADQTPAAELPLTPEDVEEIVSILSKSSYDTLDIETARFRLRVSRTGEGWTQEWMAVGRDAEAPAARVTVSDATAVAPSDGLLVIRPPLPGTFYRAPQPGAAPFVEVGDHVTADTVVAIVETMKLMTPVHAGVTGRIVEIIPDNAELIEEGCVLMKVAPE
jgi:acetyl-CoA carboxylase biotin carboxyl carrier protein